MTSHKLDRSTITLGSSPMPKPEGNVTGAGPVKGGRNDEELGKSSTRGGGRGLNRLGLFNLVRSGVRDALVGFMK